MSTQSRPRACASGLRCRRGLLVPSVGSPYASTNPPRSTPRLHPALTSGAPRQSQTNERKEVCLVGGQGKAAFAARARARAAERPPPSARRRPCVSNCARRFPLARLASRRSFFRPRRDSARCASSSRTRCATFACSSKPQRRRLGKVATLTHAHAHTRQRPAFPARSQEDLQRQGGRPQRRSHHHAAAGAERLQSLLRVGKVQQLPAREQRARAGPDVGGGPANGPAGRGVCDMLGNRGWEEGACSLNSTLPCTT